MAGADKVIAEMSADEYRAYMEWGEIVSSANYLSDKVVAANFDLFGKTMHGRKENFPLWKRATSQVESQMGEALGRIYCERYFPARTHAGTDTGTHTRTDTGTHTGTDPGTHAGTNT